LSASRAVTAVGFPVLSPIGISVKLYEGEGVSGRLLDSSVVTLTSDSVAPFVGYADVDYYAKGIILTVGNMYTLQFFTNDSFPGATQGQSNGWWVGSSNAPYIPGDAYNCKAIVTGPTYDANGVILSYGDTIFVPNGDPRQGDPAMGEWAPGSYLDGNPGNWGVMQPNVYGCSGGFASPGDYTIHVIDQTPPPPVVIPSTCSGTGTITQSTSISKLFFVVDNTKKVAYSNVYGKPGTTIFSYNNGLTAASAFNVGNTVTYSGIPDASTVCIPDSLDFSTTVTPTPPPTPSCVAPQVLSGNMCVTPTPSVPVTTPTCVAPTGSKKASGQAVISAVGIDSVTIGEKVVTVIGCTKIAYKGHANSLGIGFDAEYQGYTINSVTYATSMTVDDGK
jgi:hypothetical protein